MASEWPSDDLTTNALDADSDTLAAARLELYAAVQKLKVVLDTRGASSGICDLDSNGYVPNARVKVGMGALAYSIGAQTVATGSFVALNFNSEAYDDLGFHGIGVNTSRMTIPSGVSRVRLMGQASFAAHTTGIRRARITKNGTAVIGTNTARVEDPDGTYDDTMHVAGEFSCSEGDYFELEALQNTGGNLLTHYHVSNVHLNCWFSIIVLRA